MTRKQFEQQISRIGDISALKEGYVFTLLITGKGLSDFSTFNEILRLISQYTHDKYPLVEVMQNTEQYALFVCKPAKS